MKRVLVLALLMAVAGAGLTMAGESGNHYPNGVEGIKAASVPPPGFYLRWYSFYYGASSLMDGDGDKVPVGFDVTVWATAPRLILVTDLKLLGANVAFDAMLPFISTDLTVKAAGVEDRAVEVGDLYLSPLILAWHGARYDAAFGLSLFAPTGGWNRDHPAKAGKGYWTGMATLGGTVYLDPGRTWSLSLLSRYEKHRERKDEKVRLGDDFHFEWGFAKSLTPTLDLGLVGYCQWQVSEDRGAELVWDGSVKDRVFAAGAEASVVFPEIMTFVSLRALVEVSARDRSEGRMVTLTVTKRL